MTIRQQILPSCCSLFPLYFHHRVALALVTMEQQILSVFRRHHRPMRGPKRGQAERGACRFRERPHPRSRWTVGGISYGRARSLFSADPHAGRRLARAQIGSAAEGVRQQTGACGETGYPELDHPVRSLAREHGRGLRRRLTFIARSRNCKATDVLAGRLAVLFNGSSVRASIPGLDEAMGLLQLATDASIPANFAMKAS